jgi:CARDB
VAVYSVSTLQNSAKVGSGVTINIIVQNLGKFTENITVVALAGDTSVAQQDVTNLAPGTNVTLTMTWDTSGYSPGSYTIGGKVLGVNGQTSFGNSLVRSATSLTLKAASTSVTSSSYFWPIIAAALVVIIAILGALILQNKRKTVAQ